jgi:hypothetical protein
VDDPFMEVEGEAEGDLAVSAALARVPLARTIAASAGDGRAAVVAPWMVPPPSPLHVRRVVRQVWVRVALLLWAGLVLLLLALVNAASEWSVAIVLGALVVVSGAEVGGEVVSLAVGPMVRRLSKLL